MYNQQFGCNFTSVVPTNIFGKYDNFDLNQGARSTVRPCSRLSGNLAMMQSLHSERSQWKMQCMVQCQCD